MKRLLALALLCACHHEGPAPAAPQAAPAAQAASALQSAAAPQAAPAAQTAVAPQTAVAAQPTPAPASAAAPADGPAAAAPRAADLPPKPDVAFVDLPTKLTAGLCTRVLVALVRGSAKAQGESLAAGDVLALTNADAFDVTGQGLAVTAVMPVDPCSVRARPAMEKRVVRAAAAKPLTFASGAMTAKLDVDRSVSPDFYLGRLEGTAPVAEHAHAGSWEILAAIDGAGMFAVDGKEAALSPRQIVVVPPGTKHAWQPAPGSRLRAVQIYAPAGPEQRFVTLAGSK